MSDQSNNPVTESLRRLPEIDPPADAWARIRASQHRPFWARPKAVWSGVAVAACAALIVVSLQIREPESAVTAPMVVEAAPTDSAPVVPTAVGGSAGDRGDVEALRRQSRQLELRLAALPRRSQVVRADVAGMISELQDQIAAVDYQIRRTGSASSSTARWPAPTPAAVYSVDRVGEYEQDQLWGERVQLMDRLVRVRFAEAGVAAY